MPYTPVVSVIEQEKIGTLYHIGLGTTTPGLSTPDRVYGYMLVADQQLGRFLEKTDLHSKDQLTQYSSDHLIDRDFVNTPRVTDGDFSGGALQQNFLDSHRFWDSDLDIRVPGYISLRAGWGRQQLIAAAAAIPQSVAFNNDVYTTFQDTNVYNSAGTASAAGITCKLLDTDGDRLYAADGVNTLRQSNSLNPAVWANLSTTIGAITQMWVIQLGTTGRFIYYTTDNRSLNIFDLNTSVQGIAVPLGGTAMQIVDVVAYQARVAILTKDPGGTGFDVWYHDGLNLQHIIRVNQFIPSGMCAILGQLFITAQSASQWEPPILARIGAGTFEIILRAGQPFATQTAATIGAPYAGDQYVYFALGNPQLTGISAQPYIGVYDVLSGSYSHLGNRDASDAPEVSQPRQLAASGRAVAFPMRIGAVGYLQFQTNSSRFPVVANTTYQPSGWVCSSRLDFNTPSIDKLFRRIALHHAALKAGEAILVNAYMDTDPMTFTTVLATNPAGATVTNLTVGSTITVLTLPTRTIGRSMVFAFKETAGTNNATTPKVFYASVEVSVPWTWEGWLDLTHKRQLLDGDIDNQGVIVQDLYWLLHNAWENSQPVTVFHPNGTTYTAAIESLEFQAFNPVNISTPEHPPGIEWWCHVLLRDSLV
jgi:hypothetical protein